MTSKDWRINEATAERAILLLDRFEHKVTCYIVEEDGKAAALCLHPRKTAKTYGPIVEIDIRQSARDFAGQLAATLTDQFGAMLAHSKQAQAIISSLHAVNKGMKR